MSQVDEVTVDGSDFTNFALEGSYTPRLNRPDSASVKLPMTQIDAEAAVGTLLRIVVDGELVHHGRILSYETTADADMGYTVLNSENGLELWKWRPVRDAPSSADPGDMTKPIIIEEFVTGPQIIEAAMDASENVALIPSKAEGPLYLTRGSFELGGVDLTGAPTDWPMTMAHLAGLLIGTGEVDIVITPIELDIDGNYGQIDVYNGDFGLDLTSSVAFQYGVGLHNISGFRATGDMTNLCNKLWYYLGPRVKSSDDPAGDQHWRANITATDGGLPEPGRSTIITCQGTDAGSLSPPDSRGKYGVRMDVRIYDARGNEATVAHELYFRLWEVEAWLRCGPQTIVNIVPIRDYGINDFGVGDLVLVEATPDAAGGFSGVQRIYSYTVGWDQDSVLAITQLQTSPDNQGFE